VEKPDPRELALPPGLAGRTAGPLVHDVDARWLMAFVAALGDSPDAERPHPLFPVAYEWPAALALRASLPPGVDLRGVHATHDLQLHRLPRAGDRLSTTAAVVGVAPRRSGAFVLVRFETVDAAGEPVSTTDYGTVYRGVACEGSALPSSPVRPALKATMRWSARVAVPATLAHVYTECARIWNPIHTDRAVARAAGLPDIVLHGTATLGLAVSRLLAREADGEPARVRRISARLGAMVRLPSSLVVNRLEAVDTPEGRWVGFEVLTATAGPAVRDGRLLLARS
jgi:acyl dehydratase